MSRYRFLLSRRWLTIALVAVLVAVVCVFLGRWQWDRHEARAAANDLVTTNYDAQPVALDSMVSPRGAVTAQDVWRPVELSGRFVGEQLVLRNRPVVGADSARVLAVLDTAPADGGGLVVVDRGWVAQSGEDLTPPPYPDGVVTLTARLREAEGADSRTAPPGRVYRVHPATVLSAAGVETRGEVLEGYVQAVVAPQSPAAQAGLAQVPRPDTDPGSHLSYAFQWWVFALGSLVGFAILARREAAELRGEPAPARRRSADADAEDALIDAQLVDDASR